MRPSQIKKLVARAARSNEPSTTAQTTNTDDYRQTTDTIKIHPPSEEAGPEYCMFGQGKIIRFSIAPGDLQSKGLCTAFQMKKKLAPDSVFG